jgi:hypothetical protein
MSSAFLPENRAVAKAVHAVSSRFRHAFVTICS